MGSARLSSPLDGACFGCYDLEEMFQCVAKEISLMAKKRATPTFLLELPLVVEDGAARRVRAHLEAGRQFYNAVLSEGQRRLRRMRADPAWQAARAIPHSHKQERQAPFSALPAQHGLSVYAPHPYAQPGRVDRSSAHHAAGPGQ